MSLVILTSVPTEADAAIICGMLDANGISSVTNDRNNAYVPIFGGVDILVDQNDLDSARQLLQSHHDPDNQ